MRKLYFVLFLGVLLLSSCQSDFDKFTEQLASLSKDSIIDQHDFRTLAAFAGGADDLGFKAPFMNDNQLDSTKFASYLFDQTRLIYPKFIRQNVYLLSSPANASLKYTVNVFIENSVSMDGYVSGVTSFGQAVYGLVSDLKLADRTGSINLNYINSNVIHWKTNADDNDIAGFVRGLNPSTFRARGGNRANSDLHQCLKTALHSVDSSQLSVFVSDCIFSPGRRKNASDFLVNQQIALKTTFHEKLDSLDFDTMILQYYADFKGDYYDSQDTPTPLPLSKRPFYIIIAGTSYAMEQLLGRQDINKLRQTGFRQSFVLAHMLKSTQASPGQLHAKLSMKNRIGEFDIDHSKHNLSLVNVLEGKGNPKTDGIFQFSVAADLSGGLVDDAFLLDTANYNLPPNYTLSQVRLNKDENDKALKGMTHLFTLTTTKLNQDQDVTLELKDNVPAWIDSSNSDDDSNIRNAGQLGKTFGFKHLVNGIADAYEHKYQGKELFKLHINVSKSALAGAEDEGGFPWGILIIIAAIAGIVIYIKNKK